MITLVQTVFVSHLDLCKASQLASLLPHLPSYVLFASSTP